MALGTPTIILQCRVCRAHAVGLHRAEVFKYFILYDVIAHADVTACCTKTTCRLWGDHVYKFPGPYDRLAYCDVAEAATAARFLFIEIATHG